jgi:hypothetical protein
VQMFMLLLEVTIGRSAVVFDSDIDMLHEGRMFVFES